MNSNNREIQKETAISNIYESIDCVTHVRYIKLYVAVLDQVIRDANSVSKSKYCHMRKLEAKRYLSLKCKSFLEICELANVSPQLVLEAAKHKNISLYDYLINVKGTDLDLK